MLKDASLKLNFFDLEVKSLYLFIDIYESYKFLMVFTVKWI